MPKSLKDQLKDWRAEKREVADALRDVEKDARRARVQAEEERRRAAEASASRASEAEDGHEDDDVDLSDEELFRRAIEGVRSGSDAILQKYDKTDAPQSPGGGPGGRARRDTSDQALFLQAVGEMRREDVEQHKPVTTSEKKPADARFARRVAKGEIEPANVLDLHGDDRTRALARARVFLDAEARSRTEVVLIVHGKGAGVLAGEVERLLDGHPLVVEHVAAPRDLGGEGARVVRLRSPTSRRSGGG